MTRINGQEVAQTVEVPDNATVGQSRLLNAALDLWLVRKGVDMVRSAYYPRTKKERLRWQELASRVRELGGKNE